MASAETQSELFTAISTTLSETMSADMMPSTRAKAIETLALAFRYAKGGSQPGGAGVENR